MSYLPDVMSFPLLAQRKLPQLWQHLSSILDFHLSAVTQGGQMTQGSKIPLTSIHQVEADGVHVFDREAGPQNAPVVLLLHGFPTSSFQYRELIPRLADRYRVIAPDLP